MRTILLLKLMLSFAPLLWCQPVGMQEAAQYQNQAASLLLNGEYEEAIRQLEAAAALYKAAGEWALYFSCLNQSTNAYLSLGRMDDAKRTAKKALWESIQKMGRDNDEAARAAHCLAEVYSQAGRHEKAIEVHRMGLMIRESIYGERHPKLADSYDWFARAWLAAGDFSKADEYYRSALNIRENLLGRQHPDAALSFTNLGRLEFARHNYAKALEYHQQALGIRKARLGPQHPDVASSLISMARINRRLGKSALAGNQYREATIVFRENMDTGGEEAAEAFHYLAEAQLDKGALPAALQYAKQSIRALAFNPRQYAALLYQNHYTLGAILMEMGRHQEAAASFRQAIAADKREASAACYRQWCEALHRSGDTSAAISAAHTYLEWAKQQESPGALPDARARLGCLLVETDSLDEGVRQLAQALNHPDAPYWLLQKASLALADAYRRQGQYEQAMQQYQQLARELEQSNRAGSLHLRLQTLLALGESHSTLASQDRNTLYNLEAALDIYKSCDHLLFRLLRSPLPGEQLSSLSEAQSRLYSNAIRDCYSLYQQNQDKGYLDKAFYFSERSKRLSLQLPLLLLPPGAFDQAPKILLDAEAEQKNRALALLRAIQNNLPEGDSIDSLVRELERAEAEYGAALARLEREAPDYYHFKFGAAVAGIEELDAFLQRHSASMYAYFAGEDGLYIFYSHGKGLQLARRPMDDAFYNNLRSFLALALNAPEAGQAEVYGQYAAQAVSLYEKLIPGNPGPGPRQLFLLPHGPLQLLPFDALLPHAPPQANFSSLPYLGLTHSLAYHASATTLKAAWEQTGEVSYDIPFAAFLSSATQEQLAMKGAYGRSGKGASSLSVFTEPARAWAARYGGSLWEGPDVREAAFRKLPPAETLLLAIPVSIGLLPDDTFLSFAPEKDSLYDNRFYLEEAYGLPKPVELCIMASSLPQSMEHTAWPQLARAMQYSGCRSLLFQRWPVAGPPSAELLGIFLARRQEGGSLPLQLMEARQAYLRSQSNAPERAHPRYWAGFMYYGLPAPASPVSGIPRYLIIAAVAGLIFIGWLVRLK